MSALNMQQQCTVLHCAELSPTSGSECSDTGHRRAVSSPHAFLSKISTIYFLHLIETPRARSPSLNPILLPGLLSAMPLSEPSVWFNYTFQTVRRKNVPLVVAGECLVPGLPGHDGALVLLPGPTRQAALVQRHHLQHNNHHIIVIINKLAVQVGPSIVS